MFIYVMRHGKSDWGEASRDDHARPLKERGRRAARTMGELLSLLGEEPDLVLTSSAERARTTAQLAYEAGDWTAPVEILDELYETSPTSVIELLRAIDPDVSSVLLVGHEPTSSGLVALLTNGARPVFPTAALAKIQVESDTWSSLGLGAGALTWLLTPRILQSLLDGRPSPHRP